MVFQVDGDVFQEGYGGFFNDISHKAIWRMSGKHPAGDTLRMRPLLKWCFFDGKPLENGGLMGFNGF